MDKNIIIEDICRCIESHDSININKNTRLFDELGFDSIMVIDLVVEIETKYNIEFMIEDLIFDNFETVGKLADIVMKYMV